MAKVKQCLLRKEYSAEIRFSNRFSLKDFYCVVPAPRSPTSATPFLPTADGFVVMGARRCPVAGFRLESLTPGDMGVDGNGRFWERYCDKMVVSI